MNIIVAYILGIITCVLFSFIYNLYLVYNDSNITYNNDQNNQVLQNSNNKSINNMNQDKLLVTSNIIESNDVSIINKELLPRIDYDLLLENSIMPVTTYIKDDNINDDYQIFFDNDNNVNILDKKDYNVRKQNYNINKDNKILNFKSKQETETNIDLNKIQIKSLKH